jgi:hypothetical protein
MKFNHDKTRKKINLQLLLKELICKKFKNPEILLFWLKKNVASQTNKLPFQIFDKDKMKPLKIKELP